MLGLIPIIRLMIIKATIHPQALRYNSATVMFKKSSSSLIKGCKGNLKPKLKVGSYTAIQPGGGYQTVSYNLGLIT